MTPPAGFKWHMRRPLYMASLGELGLWRVECSPDENGHEPGHVKHSEFPNGMPHHALYNEPVRSPNGVRCASKRALRRFAKDALDRGYGDELQKEINR